MSAYPAPHPIPQHAPPLIWVLLGEKKGDNAQAIAAAGSLGLQFQKKQLSILEAYRDRRNPQVGTPASNRRAPLALAPARRVSEKAVLAATSGIRKPAPCTLSSA